MLPMHEPWWKQHCMHCFAKNSTVVRNLLPCCSQCGYIQTQDGPQEASPRRPPAHSLRLWSQTPKEDPDYMLPKRRRRPRVPNRSRFDGLPDLSTPRRELHSSPAGLMGTMDVDPFAAFDAPRAPPPSTAPLPQPEEEAPRASTAIPSPRAHRTVSRVPKPLPVRWSASTRKESPAPWPPGERPPQRFELPTSEPPSGPPSRAVSARHGGQGNEGSGRGSQSARGGVGGGPRPGGAAGAELHTRPVMPPAMAAKLGSVSSFRESSMVELTQQSVVLHERLERAGLSHLSLRTVERAILPPRDAPVDVCEPRLPSPWTEGSEVGRRLYEMEQLRGHAIPERVVPRGLAPPASRAPQQRALTHPLPPPRRAASVRHVMQMPWEP